MNQFIIIRTGGCRFSAFSFLFASFITILPTSSGNSEVNTHTVGKIKKICFEVYSEKNITDSFILKINNLILPPFKEINFILYSLTNMKDALRILILYGWLLGITCSLSSCNGQASPSSLQVIRADSLIEHCKAQYAHARTLQRSRQYDDAIEAFKVCLSFDSGQPSVRDSLHPIVIESMLQLMNTYQSKGAPETCVEYFSSLQDSSTVLIRKYCKRDLRSLLAYSLSRTERVEEGEKMMEEALELPLYHSTPERLFRDYAYAAAVFFSNPDKQEQVIGWCKLAMEQAELCENTSGVQWLTSLLGTLYKRTGRLEEAIDLFQKSVDEARKKRDTLGEANACNSLTELYLYWDILDEANSHASQAIRKNAEQGGENPMVSTQSFLLKGKVMQKMGHPDSAAYYWQKAEDCCRELPYNSGLVDVDGLMGALMVERCTGDSLSLGMERLQRVVRQATPTNCARACYQLALGHFKQHREQEAEAMLDSMYHLLHSFDTPVRIGIDYDRILNHYINKHDAPNIERYALDLVKECKFIHDEDTRSRMYETIVKFRTEKKEQELRMVQMELDNNRLHIRLYLFAFTGIMALLLVVFFYKRRLYRMKQQLMEQRLSALLDDLQNARRQSSNMEQQLSELLTDKNERKEVEAITPQLLHEKGEPKFRQRFEQLYPVFLPALREKVPDIGRKEELLCMLIVLGQDSYQIEQIMGIAHRSVNMARYRLRKKLEMGKDDSLDDVIRALAKPSDNQ